MRLPKEPAQVFRFITKYKGILKFSICTKLETGKSLLLIWGML